MKLEISRKEFVKAWKQLESCGSKLKEAYGIKITAFDEVIGESINNTVALTIRNMEGVTVKESGQAVIPCGLLLNLISKASDDAIELEINMGKGVLKSGRNKTRFAVKPLENFPKLPDKAEAKDLTEISSSELIKLVLQGSSASGNPAEFPKYLGAVWLKFMENKVLCASTDGKRLALTDCDIGEEENRFEEYLLPASELRGVVTELEGDTVKISADEAMMYFENEGTVYAVRRIQASFPQYERLISSDKVATVKIKVSELLPALERIDIVARNNPAKIICMSLDNELRLSVRVPEVGTAVEKVSCEFEDEKLVLGFNINFLRDGLKLFDEVEMEFSGEQEQMRMYESGKRDCMYMLMPARLAEEDKIIEDEE